MAKLPAFFFYTGDWRKDTGVQSLSYHDRGVWFELLCFMHESERRGVLLLNGQAIPEESLARLLGLDKQILTTTLTTLLTSGVASRDEATGALMCRRMVRDEQIRQIRQTAGLKGGNPVLLNQKSTTVDNQTPTKTLKMKMKNESEDEDELESKNETSTNTAEQLYQAYPRKVGKGAALKAIKVALGKVDFGVLLEAVQAYAMARVGQDRQYTPHPATWFNQGRWNDDRSEWAANTNGKPEQFSGIRAWGERKMAEQRAAENKP